MDYLNYLKACRELEKKYPFISVDSVGKSVMGKDILSLTVGVAKEYVLFIGGLHGTEHFTSSRLLAFFSSLCRALAEDGVIAGFKVRRALLGRALIVLPALNPDGCEIASIGKSGCGNIADRILKLSGGNMGGFRLNARGVDVELNFESGNRDSEPETASAISLLKNTCVRHAVIFGEGERRLVTPKNYARSDRLTRMSDIITASTGFTVSDEKELSTGFVDRVYADFSVPAFKVLCNADDKTAQDLTELMMLFTVM